MDFLKPVSGLRASILSVLISIGIFFIFRFVFRNAFRASLLTSITVIFLFLYNPIRLSLSYKEFIGIPLTSFYLYSLLWGVLYLLAVWAVGWKLKTPEEMSAVFNFVSLALLGVLIVQMFIIRQQAKGFSSANLNVRSIAQLQTQIKSGVYPDIYYIILDGYSGNHTLLEEYGFDNQEFIRELQKRGFFVADCAHSNYAVTSFSMASSLNLDYIPPVGAKFLKGNHSWRDFKPYIQYNVVRSTLKEMGYQTIAFDTYLQWPNISNADVYISPKEIVEFDILQLARLLVGGTNEYEQMLVDSTPLILRHKIGNYMVTPHSSQANSSGSDPLIKWETNNMVEQEKLYDYYLYDLNNLASVSDLEGRKFVYAHFLTTHRPFLFSEDGSFKPDQTKNGYIKSIKFTNASLLRSIDQILETSDPKPVIIIQGDHSLPGSNDAFGILNAYHLPDGGNSILYPTISPVNTFRVVFNKYFGMNLPLLKDNSYWMHEFRGKIIPELQDQNCD